MTRQQKLERGHHRAWWSPLRLIPMRVLRRLTLLRLPQLPPVANFMLRLSRIE
jgi:hypothetical protein